MWLCYHLTNNYGVALFLFTLLTKLALVPLSLKQQRSSAKMMAIQPYMLEIQNKYKDNPEKMNTEIMKLYQKTGGSPMSGCLPMLIQMPILFGLIEVIYRPIKHILRLPAEVITTIENKVLELGLVPSLNGLNHAQIKAVQAINENAAPFMEIGQEHIDKVLNLNMNFFGMNLGLTPEWGMFADILKGQFNPLLFVPVLSGVSALAATLISMRMSSASSVSENTNAAGGVGMKGMMFMMPVFSFAIACSVPAGVGIYWFYSNILGLVQTILLNKFCNPRELAEKQKQELAAVIQIQQIEEDQATQTTACTESKTQREANRKKLELARKRDAERYGEEYVPVADSDLL